MDNCKSAKICAYVSLAFSAVLMVLWICNVGGPKVLSIDTFVGVIVALLAIIVTLAIAWQIFNVVEMRNRIRELNKLEDRLKKQEKSFDQFNIISSANMNRLAGLSALQAGLITYSFKFMLAALKYEMLSEKPTHVDYFLGMLEDSAKIITPNTKFDAEEYELVVSYDKEIRSLDNYNLIKGRYESIYKDFMSKVEKEEEQQ